MTFRLSNSVIRWVGSFTIVFGVFLLMMPGGPLAASETTSASLTIDVYTCDPGYDPIDPHETLVNPCAHGAEDIPFTLQPLSSSAGSAMVSTGTGGAPATISFSNLTAGDYRLIQQTPDTIRLSFLMQCASNVREFDYPFTPFAIIESGGRLNIHLLAGERLTCDWYNVQAESMR